MRRNSPAALIAAVLALAPGCKPEAPAAPIEAPAPEFVGSAACAECHAAAASAWRGSQHAHAIQLADPNGVLGDFKQAEFRFRDGSYYVHAAGPDGALADFRVKYSFGLEPLQQYLLELPGGRLQAYTRAWDVHARRWIDLYPDEKLVPGDELHWSGRQQNWNSMCADCHSTNVRKGYDPATRSFDTKWSDFTVGCEACHGPGSGHVAWARTHSGEPGLGLTVALGERRGAHWSIDPLTGNGVRSRPHEGDTEIETCAPCHSRRAQLAEGWRAGAQLLDYYRPALLESPGYWADGQQRAEDYTWGSFLQSRMYAHGVTCSDCHEPHTGELRAEGNALCAQCHSAEKYDAPAHHFHPANSAGAACVACHMPTATYMQVDPRHDHSLRVPRPAQTVTLGVPNACESCHRERGAAWAAAELRKRLGHDPSGFQSFGLAFRAAELHEPGAAAALAAIAADSAQSALARASALARLAQLPDGAEAGLRGARDPSALVRLGAAMLANGLTAETRVAVAAPLCADPARAVRVEAAGVLAGVPRDLFTPAQGAAFARASSDYIAAQRFAAERPEAHVNLGTFYANVGRFDDAQTEFAAALVLEPAFIPALVNSADAHRAQGRDDDALRALETAKARAPGSAPVAYALGLALSRKGQAEPALAELERAAKLAPDDPLYPYTAAVALHSMGRSPEAIRRLQQLAKRWPGNRDILFGLATMQRDAGQRPAARATAESLVATFPNDRTARALLEELSRAASPPSSP